MDDVGELWFSVRQGEALAKTFTFTEAGAAVALSLPLMQGVRRNAPSDRIDFAPTITGAGNNVVTLAKTSDQTFAMTPGDYLWDLLATGADGQQVRMEGVFEVVDTRSRPLSP